MRRGGAENPITHTGEKQISGPGKAAIRVIELYQSIPDAITPNLCGNEPRHCSNLAIANIRDTGTLIGVLNNDPPGIGCATSLLRPAIVGAVAATLFVASRGRS